MCIVLRCGGWWKLCGTHAPRYKEARKALLRPERDCVKGNEPISKIMVAVWLATLLFLAMSSVSAGEDFYIIHSADVRGYVDPCG